MDALVKPHRHLTRTRPELLAIPPALSQGLFTRHGEPRTYRQSAQVYDALSRGKDYAAAAARLHELVQRLTPRASSLLDVACGTGRHLEYLKAHYHVEGFDLSPEMLEIARKRCPDTPLHAANFQDFELGRVFDVVTCLFGAIGYAKTVENLERAIQCMARHVGGGGMLIVEPWVTPERYLADRIVFDTVNDPDLKVARIYVSRREGRLSTYDIEFLVATQAGVTHFSEHEQLGLFSREEYLAALHGAGLTVTEEDAEGLFGYGLFVGVKLV